MKEHILAIKKLVPEIEYTTNTIRALYDISYLTARELIKEWQQHNIISIVINTTKHKPQQNKYVLTTKGINIQNKIIELNKILEQP